MEIPTRSNTNCDSYSLAPNIQREQYFKWNIVPVFHSPLRNVYNNSANEQILLRERLRSINASNNALNVTDDNGRNYGQNFYS